jgi:hypothetical protein
MRRAAHLKTCVRQFNSQVLTCLLSTYSVHTLVLTSCTWFLTSSDLVLHGAKPPDELKALLQLAVPFVYLHNMKIVV